MGRDLTKLSKLIALVLRHKPETLGLLLDSHGWANTKQLVSAINNREKFTMKDLEEIVSTDEKQRYSFNSDKSMIRANQGHSIDVDVELEEAIPPDILYHGTAKKYFSNIMKEGLKPQSRLYVHLSTDEKTAINVGSRHGDPIVFKIDTKQMERDGYKFYRSVNNVWLTKEVPTEYFMF